MKFILIVCCILITGSALLAQPAKDKEAILNLCGCYDVNFKYAETFSPLDNYRYANRYETGGVELVLPVLNTGKKIVLQHLLLLDDTTVMKHWREDWEFEKADWWQFTHDAVWKHITATKPVKGEWTQTVWEVDDAPRYQGSATWLANDNKFYWENTTDAPLPRREYTKRNDYNVMQRTNKIFSTDTGWVHEQDNNKLVRKDGAADALLVQEKGLNVYKKIDNKFCAAGLKYWEAHKEFWATVRQGWEEIMKHINILHVLPEVNKQKLYEHLFAMEEETGAESDSTKQEVMNLLHQYTGGTQEQAAK